MDTKHTPPFERVPDLVARITNENAALRAQVAELAAALQFITRYLDHPEVEKIPFALPASVAIDRASVALAKVRP